MCTYVWKRKPTKNQRKTTRESWYATNWNYIDSNNRKLVRSQLFQRACVFMYFFLVALHSISLIIVAAIVDLLCYWPVVVSFKSFQLIKNMVSVFQGFLSFYLSLSLSFVSLQFLFIWKKIMRFVLDIIWILSSNSARIFLSICTFSINIWCVLSLLLFTWVRVAFKSPFHWNSKCISNAWISIVHLTFVIQMHLHQVFWSTQKNK